MKSFKYVRYKETFSKCCILSKLYRYVTRIIYTFFSIIRQNQMLLQTQDEVTNNFTTTYIYKCFSYNNNRKQLLCLGKIHLNLNMLHKN